MTKEEIKQTKEIKETLKYDLIISKVVAALCLMGVVAAAGAFWDVQNLKANQSSYKANIDNLAKEVRTIRVLQCHMALNYEIDRDSIVEYCSP